MIFIYRISLYLGQSWEDANGYEKAATRSREEAEELFQTLKAELTEEKRSEKQQFKRNASKYWAIALEKESYITEEDLNDGFPCDYETLKLDEIEDK